MPATSTVRAARPSDEDALLDLLERRHSESGFGSFDASKTRNTVQRAIAQHQSIAGVVDGAGGPEATIGLTVAQWWDSADFMLQAVWDYVVPEARRTDHSKSMIHFAQVSADRLGMPLMMGGVTREADMGRMMRYSKSMAISGAFFLYSGPDTPIPTKSARERKVTQLCSTTAMRLCPVPRT